MPQQRHTLSAHDIRAVAVAAKCDPRSVARYLRGSDARRTVTHDRIEEALLRLNLGHLLRARRVQVSKLAVVP